MNEKKREFSLLRVLLMIILPMLFYNIGMSVIQGTLWRDLMQGELLGALTTLLGMSVLGLLLTPAALALSVFAMLVEMLYRKGKILNYWLFSMSAGVIGMLLCMVTFLIAGSRISEFAFSQCLLMFIIHMLSAMLVYRKIWQHIEKPTRVQPETVPCTEEER